MSLLEIHNLSKKYGSQFANKDINLTVERGEIYGLIGQNGAGKTTLIKQIAGFIIPDSGSIKWDSRGIEKISRGIAITPERINKTLTAFETLYLYGNSFSKTTKEEICDVLYSVGLYEQRDKRIGKYSAGMVQKLLLSLAIIGNPEFLILDEPMNGLDPSSVKKMNDLLYKLNKEKNTTMIISSHLLGQLMKISSKYGLMVDGQLVKEFSENDIADLNETERETFVLRALEHSCNSEITPIE